MTHFKGKQFKKDIITVAVGYYLKYNLSDRTIDSSGSTLDIGLRKGHDKQAAYDFFNRLIKQFVEPRALVTDNASSLSSAFNQFKPEGEFANTTHRTSKYLNNMI